MNPPLDSLILTIRDQKVILDADLAASISNPLCGFVASCEINLF